MQTRSVPSASSFRVQSYRGAPRNAVAGVSSPRFTRRVATNAAVQRRLSALAGLMALRVRSNLLAGRRRDTDWLFPLRVATRRSQLGVDYLVSLEAPPQPNRQGYRARSDEYRARYAEFGWTIAGSSYGGRPPRKVAGIGALGKAARGVGGA